MADGAFLCEGCPGKGNASVDLDVIGSCPTYTLDSFRQTRGYRLEGLEGYSSNEEMAALSANTLRYYDPDEDDFYERTGDLAAAEIGIACAERLLAGSCPKTRSQMLLESDIDE